MTTWRILSSGPSIEDLDELPGEGPVVAINHAILHPIEADFWCCHEWGRAIQDGLAKRAEGPKEETWVGRRYLDQWTVWNNKRGLFGLKKLRLVAHPDDDAGFQKALYSSRRWQSTAHWGGISFFAALANCILRGAGRIECFGVDMKGDLNYGGVRAGAAVRQDYRHRTKPDSPRWLYERRRFDRIAEEAALHGVEIVRIG